MCARPSSPLQISYYTPVTEAKVLQHAVLHQGLRGHESDGALRQHRLGEADLAGPVEDSVLEHLGLGDRGVVADLERATGTGTHGLLLGEPRDGSSRKGCALLDG